MVLASPKGSNKGEKSLTAENLIISPRAPDFQDSFNAQKTPGKNI